jgi:hypothetical protein
MIRTAIKRKIKKISGYAECPSQALSTTKSTKDTKRDFKFILFCLRGLRDEVTIGHIQLEITRQPQEN